MNNFPNIFDLLPDDIFPEIIRRTEAFKDLPEVIQLSRTNKLFGSLVFRSPDFVRAFNRRQNSPTWGFHRYVTDIDSIVGAVQGVRLNDELSITHHLDAQPHFPGEIQEWEPEAFELMDVSGNLLLFLLRQTNRLLVKDPFSHVDLIVPLSEHLFNQDSFLGQFHSHIDRLEQDNVFEIVHVKVVDQVLRYCVYNSQHQVWVSKQLVEVAVNDDEGDQTNTITIIENGFRYVVFFRENANGVVVPHCKTGAVIAIDVMAGEHFRHIYFGEWWLCYTYDEDQIPFVRLHDVSLSRRYANGTGYEHVSEIPFEQLYIDLQFILNVTCREIDGVIYVVFQTRRVFLGRFRNINYMYQYVIGEPQQGWKLRVRYLEDENNLSPIFVTNRLTLRTPPPILPLQ